MGSIPCNLFTSDFSQETLIGTFAKDNASLISVPSPTNAPAKLQRDPDNHQNGWKSGE